MVQKRKKPADPLMEKLLSLKRRKRMLFLIKAAGECVGIGLVPVLLGLILVKLRGWPFDPLLYGSCLGAGLAAIWIVWRGVLSRIRIIECSHDADVAHHLKDRLTSALYLKPFRKRDPMVNALIDDANEKSGRVNPKAVYPWRFPESWRLSGVAALCTLMIFFVPFLGWFENEGAREDRQQIIETGKKLIKLAKEVEKQENKLRIEQKTNLPEKLKKIGEKFELGKLDKGKALEELNKLRDQIKDSAKDARKPAEEKFLADLSKKLMADDASRKLGEELKMNDLKGLLDELRKLQERLEQNKLSDAELAALENLSQSMKEAFEANPEIGELLDKEAMERALKSLEENLAKERELRKKMKSILQELKEASERFNLGLTECGLENDTEDVEKALEKLLDEFIKNGSCSKQAIGDMRKAVEEANEAMQDSGSSALQKRLAQDRADEMQELLDKLERQCDKTGG
ncbi:hypothetical protein J7K50_07165 [bacterium]|nr:hypothetical protein [bacterium]